MTSPDKSVPAGAYTGTAAGDISALQSVTFASAQASVLATVSSAFAGVASAGGDMTQTTQNALNAATTAQAGASTANSTASAAQNSTAANSVVIGGLLAGQQAQADGGSVFADDFNRSTLGSDYTTFKVGPVADLVVAGGEVGLAQDGDQNTGYVLAVNAAHTTATDDQAVSAVMGTDRTSTIAGAILIARAAVDLSTFVWAAVDRTQVVLGCATGSSGNFSRTTWDTSTAQVHTGDLVTLECIGSTYQVLVNGAAMASATDAAKVSPVGPANRHFGFGSQYYWSGLSWSFSFNIAGLTAADLAAPTVSGTGWSLQCLSSSISAPSGEVQFPAGTFDTLRLPASNVTIVNQGLGQVQVNKAGWYAVSIAYYLASQIVSPTGCDLWWAPSTAGPWAILRSGYNGASAVYNSAAAETFVVYLAAGSLVCPGYSITSNGTITGPNTYFDGAFISY